MKKRAEHEAGYVLHTYPYKETSLIVELFARRFGRVALLARGARRPRVPFCHSVREPLARGWSLDQFPHPRNPQKRAINGEIQGNQRYLPGLDFATIGLRSPKSAFALRATAEQPSLSNGLPSRSCGAAKAGGPAWI